MYLSSVLTLFPTSSTGYNLSSLSRGWNQTSQTAAANCKSYTYHMHSLSLSNLNFTHTHTYIMWYLAANDETIKIPGSDFSNYIPGWATKCHICWALESASHTMTIKATARASQAQGVLYPSAPQGFVHLNQTISNIHTLEENNLQ